MAALEKIQVSMANQETINQTVNKRFVDQDKRFAKLESAIQDIILSKMNSSGSTIPPEPTTTPASSHPSNTDAPPASSNKQSNPAKKSTPTGANIASKPPVTLTNRNVKRFIAPLTPLNLTPLIPTHITFPARDTNGVLLHEAYLPEFKSKLLEIDSTPIPGFDPLDHNHIADPKYQDLTEDRRIRLAHALQQDRCMRTLYFIRPHLLPGVAKYFTRQEWISNTIAQDILNQRLPRPTKRRPEPHSSVAQALQDSQTAVSLNNSFSATPTASQATYSHVPPLPTLRDYYGNPVASEDMDITPDFASNASSAGESRPDSPISDAVKNSPSTPLTCPPNPVSRSYLTQHRITNLHICSLNCGSLAKPANLELSRSFSRFLISSDLDILCLQETYSSDPDVQNRLDIQLKSKTSIWTHYCGVVSLNPAIQLDDAFVSTNGRLIICTVSHVSNLFPSFRLMNIYAPASPFARYDFYADLLQLPYFRTLLFSQLPTQSFSFSTEAPTMIVGDFNYNFRHFPSSSIRTNIHDPDFLTNLHLNFPSPPEPTSSTLDGSFPMPTLDLNDPSNMPPQSRAQWLWHAMLQHYYQECSHRLQTDPLIPTFTNNQYRSTIDYMYVAPPLTDFLHTSQVEFIGSQWTDHAMLSLHFKILNNNHGKCCIQRKDTSSDNIKVK
ncbi:hypothetical protein PS15p_210528 [Mucor circinelloides]